MQAPSRSGRGGRVEGLVAIVTGAGAPESADPVTFGYAIAAALASEGARVTLLDRDPSALERAVTRVRAQGGHATGVLADLSDRTTCTAAVDRVVADDGRVDVLVNNAAIIGAGWDLEAPDEAFLQTMDVNWMGAVRMSRACVPHMNNASAIVNIASIGADHDFGMLDYSSSKGALLSLTYSMSAMYGPRGIRVNAVSPGTMWSQMSQRRLEQADATPEEIQRQRGLRSATVPLLREGSGWDVAQAVLFLASAESQWITGQNLVVDAGLGRTGWSSATQK